MLQGLLYIFLMLFSPEIFAGMYDPPPTDKSVGILGMIFGSNIGYIYLGGVANPTANSVMEKFNIIIVMVGTIVVSYVAVLSVINTAQEGETMGKRWSAVWTPLRSVAGMVLMIPSPASGYSIVQVTVTWIILQGIGAADQVWNLALDGLKQGVSATLGAQAAPNGNPGNANMSTLSASADKLTQDLLNVSICMQALQQFGKTGDHARLQDWLNQHSTYIKPYAVGGTGSSSNVSVNADHTQATASVTLNVGVNDPAATQTFQAAPCGMIRITSSASTSDFKNTLDNASVQDKDKKLIDAAQTILDTKKVLVSNMLSILQPLAQAIVANSLQGEVLSPDDSILNHPDLKRAKDPKSMLQPVGYYAAATSAYTNIISNLTVPMDSQSLSADLKSAISQGENLGWIVAGAYYFVFTHSSPAQVFNDVYNAPFVLNEPSCTADCTNNLYKSAKYDLDQPNPSDVFSNLSLSHDERQRLNTWLSTGYIYLQNDKNNTPGSFSLGGGLDQSGGNPIIDAIAAPMYSLVQNLISMMNGLAGSASGDVLLAHSQFGRNMMLSMEAAWIVILAAMPAIFALSMIPFVVGPAALTLGILMTALGMVIPILALIWGIGATLAVYTPLIPFIIFTTATVGWLIAVIEAIIAAPLIALGIVMPSGDELGKLETALMILANIFLRPMLMVIGFLIAGRLYNAIVYLVDQCMLQIFNTIDVKTMFSSIVILFVYASFVISLTNASFSIIYGLPDKVMRWLGGGGHSDTSMEAAEAAKRGVSAATQQMGSSGGDIAGAAHKYTGERMQAQIEKNENRRSEQKEKDKEAASALAAHKEMVQTSQAQATQKAHDEMRLKANQESTMKQQVLPGVSQAAAAMSQQRQDKAAHSDKMKDVLGELKKPPTRMGRGSVGGGGEVGPASGSRDRGSSDSDSDDEV